jgi:hypothetical protein
MVKSSMRNVKFTHVTNVVIYIITTHGKENSIREGIIW